MWCLNRTSVSQIGPQRLDHSGYRRDTRAKIVNRQGGCSRMGYLERSYHVLLPCAIWPNCYSFSLLLDSFVHAKHAQSVGLGLARHTASRGEDRAAAIGLLLWIRSLKDRFTKEPELSSCCFEYDSFRNVPPENPNSQADPQPGSPPKFTQTLQRMKGLERQVESCALFPSSLLLGGM